MSEAAEFVDTALQRESSWQRAAEERERVGGDLRFYGASVGAVRAAIRDLLRRHRDLGHDDVTALASELWAPSVFERRLAAVVLLQSRVGLLTNSDLTRIEAFVRSARSAALVDPLAIDVVGPLIERLDAPARSRAHVVLDRWSREDDVWLRRAVVLSPLGALRSGGGDWDAFLRRARAAGAEHIVQQAVDRVVAEVTTRRPELHP